MPKIMYIQASPRGNRSHSVAVADAFIQTCKQVAPDTEVVVRNVFDMELPDLDRETLQGKYNIMHGRDFSETDKIKWSAVEDVITDFTSADKHVFAIPMWNFSIPYRLKHLMDVIAQPTYTFEIGEDGYKGLVSSKAFIAYSRGGDYTEDSPFNFQATYVKAFLGFIGITDIQTVAIQPTLASGVEGRNAAKKMALDEALAIAKNF